LVGVIKEGANSLKPPNGRGVRILSLDGGGIRGLACIRMLREIERQTGRPIYDLFDFIVGTSSGGVLALGLAARMSLDRLEQVFGEIRENFRDTSVWLAEVKRVVVGISHDTEVAELNLRRAFTDDKRLRDLPRAPFTAVLATSSTREPLQPFLFRTYDLPKSARTLLEGTSDARVWEAARATSSAPTFFVPVQIGQKQYVDGAIIANNPSAVALAEASVLFPTLPIDVFVCIGTGRARDREWKAVGFAQWASKLFDLTMSSDLTHLLVGTILSPEEGQSQRYWRFDAEHDVVPAVSETSADLIDRLLSNTDTYIIEKRQAFEAVGKALSS
jgi:calcium-independent phospholipase A2-gamma